MAAPRLVVSEDINARFRKAIHDKCRVAARPHDALLAVGSSPS